LSIILIVFENEVEVENIYDDVVDEINNTPLNNVFFLSFFRFCNRVKFFIS
jgi:hypothetical protein